jgi:nitrogen fixation protein NifU and related proteins
MALDDLYQQVILDHSKEQHGRGLRDGGAADRTGQSRQVNPLCGDEVTLRVALQPGTPAVVTDVSWTGEGCSISQAATSMLHDLVVGRPAEQARTRVAAYREMVRSRGRAEPDEDLLGDAVAFVGVGRHANRVKCAMLGWTAFEAALAEAERRETAQPEAEQPEAEAERVMSEGER